MFTLTVILKILGSSISKKVKGFQHANYIRLSCTVYSAITTLYARGETEFNRCCNRNVY